MPVGLPTELIFSDGFLAHKNNVVSNSVSIYEDWTGKSENIGSHEESNSGPKVLLRLL